MMRNVSEPGATNRVARTVVTAGVLMSILASSGCGNAQEGALSGAGIGALSGLAIGSLTGNAGAGAAIGAVAGGVGGAVIGDQNRRRDEAAAAAAAQPPSQTVVYAGPPNQGYATAQTIGRLVGRWQIVGTVDNGAGGTLPVTGSATGVVDKTFFVRLDLRLNDPRTGQVVEGTSIFSQTGGRGIEMTNSFSTSPDTVRLRGEMDETGTLFNLTEASPFPGSRRIVIRMSGGREWTAEMWRGGAKAESFRFIPQ